jgi:hypothetical protein
MDSDNVILAGKCYGEFDRSDALCSTCHIRVKCIIKTKSGEGPSNVHNLPIKENEPICDVQEDVVPVDMFLSRLVDGLGTPAIDNCTLSNGSTLNVYRYYRGQDEVVRVSLGEEGKLYVLVGGRPTVEFDEDVSVKKLLSEADDILEFVVG